MKIGAAEYLIALILACTLAIFAYYNTNNLLFGVLGWVGGLIIAWPIAFAVNQRAERKARGFSSVKEKLIYDAEVKNQILATRFRLALDTVACSNGFRSAETLLFAMFLENAATRIPDLNGADILLLIARNDEGQITDSELEDVVQRAGYESFDEPMGGIIDSLFDAFKTGGERALNEPVARFADRYKKLKVMTEEEGANAVD